MKNNIDKEAGIAIAVMVGILIIMAIGGDLINNGLKTVIGG